jgi:hypothetical protein
VQEDIDLSKEGNAARVSRQQACLYLRHDGHFYITNTGRRRLSVNGRQVKIFVQVSQGSQVWASALHRQP